GGLAHLVHFLLSQWIAILNLCSTERSKTHENHTAHQNSLQHAHGWPFGSACGPNIAARSPARSCSISSTDLSTGGRSSRLRLPAMSFMRFSSLRNSISVCFSRLPETLAAMVP